MRIEKINKPIITKTPYHGKFCICKLENIYGMENISFGPVAMFDEYPDASEKELIEKYITIIKDIRSTREMINDDGAPRTPLSSPITKTFLTKAGFLEIMEIVKLETTKTPAHSTDNEDEDIVEPDSGSEENSSAVPSFMEFEKQFNSGIFTTKNGIKVNMCVAEYGGLRIGVEKSYVKHFYNYSEEANIFEFESLYNRMCRFVVDAFVHDKKAWRFKPVFDSIKELENKVTIISGAFQIDIEKKVVNNRTKLFIDKNPVSKDNITEALSRALYYENKEDYYKFLKDIKGTPIKALKLIEQGITFQLSDDRTNNPGDDKIIHWKVKKEKNKYVICGDKKEYIAKDSCRRLCSLKSNLESRFNSYRNKIYRWELYNLLSRIFEKDDALEIIEFGIEYHNTIEKKAKEFMNGLLKEHSSRIIEGEFENYGRGWFVQGIKNRYFVADDNRAYFVTPEEKRGQYICIFSPSAVIVPKYDKIVSLILALMNDERVAKSIGTLGIREV